VVSFGQQAQRAVSFDRVRPRDPEVAPLFDAFVREADGPLEVEIDIESEIAAGPPPDLVPPAGVLLLARVGGAAAGLGGVRHLNTDFAEVKTMFVAPPFRGIGLGRRILGRLEEIASERGCRAVRLDTSAYLTPAVRLYRAAGYREIPAYNENPKADLWFERRLDDEPVRIVPYDPSWPGRFEAEKAALEATLGEWAIGGIHHVGSTAVPGLDAKPIIDILVGVESLQAARGALEPLARLDYRYALYREEEMHWLCKPSPRRRTHHLHLAPVAGDRYAKELGFRDRLRADPALARRYALLKHELAQRFREDRDAYTEGKSAFIARALLGARQL
jgi:GrpB-like predicted nucleotidyltransferase (UPF0157 family)/GNAT superfamily N-acetyltransferase